MRLATLGAKIRIVGRGEPVGQYLAAVLAAAIGLRPAEELGLHHASADGMIHFAAAAIENDRLAIVFAFLAADLAEESGKAVVVVHRPAVEGMVVALGALHAHAHENLGHVLGRLERVALDLVEVGRRRGEGAAAGGEQLPHDLVQRHVAGDLLGKPVGIEIDRLVADIRRSAGADHEQFGPFHGPDFGKRLPLQKTIDKLRPLVGRFVVEEGAIFVLAGQHAGDVDRRPPQEDLVAAYFTGQDAKLPQLGVDQLIDVIGGRNCGRHVVQTEGKHDRRLPTVLVSKGQNKCLAPIGGGDQPAGATGAELSLLL